MQYDLFETDDNLSSILFYNRRLNTLELYAIKWKFDTCHLDINKLRKLDDEKIEHDGVPIKFSTQRKKSNQVQLNNDDLHIPEKNNDKSCIIF